MEAADRIPVEGVTVEGIQACQVCAIYALRCRTLNMARVRGISRDVAFRGVQYTLSDLRPESAKYRVTVNAIYLETNVL